MVVVAVSPEDVMAAEAEAEEDAVCPAIEQAVRAVTATEQMTAADISLCSVFMCFMAVFPFEMVIRAVPFQMTADRTTRSRGCRFWS